MNQSETRIFEYTDYRMLLKDLFDQKKAQDSKFSYRYFSKQAGFVSHSFLRFVILGKSDLSEDSIEKFIKGFKFNKEEGLFFKHLVLLNQAKTSGERHLHAEAIMRIKGYRKIHPLKDAQYHFYTQWYFIPIREIVGFPGFIEDLEWIAKSVTPAITPEQAGKTLEELELLGLIKRNEEGRLVQANQILATLDEVTSSAIAQWHREMMKKASESIDTISRNERDISAVTLGMSAGSVHKVKELIQNFRKELVEIVAADSPIDTVYQLNLHLFPLAKAFEGEKNVKK